MRLWLENTVALNVDYIMWIVTVLGAITRNGNYVFWKLKTSKRQGVSFFPEAKHKVFGFKTKPIL